MHDTLIKNIIQDKRRGISDQEIGDKYGLSLREIEKAITKKFGVNISNLNRKKQVKTLSPKNFNLETATVWSFKSRGNWATHNGDYRGNWSPYIPRNVILRYSKEKDLVLDYFCGAGTTAIECKLLNRDFIGYDINPFAIALARDNINFETGNLFKKGPEIKLEVGDARNLTDIRDESVDLICSHPPYANIIHYTDNNSNDLSHLSIAEFLFEMDKVASESYRVLKPEKNCAILIGDMRKNKNVVPLGFLTIERFLKAGFQIQDLIIKRQHNCKTTGFWYNNSIKYNFLLLAHEYLVVFKKTWNPENNSTLDFNINVLHPFVKIYNDIKLESTSVWIFNAADWLEKTLANLFKRYYQNSYHTYTQEDSNNNIVSLTRNNYNTIYKFIISDDTHIDNSGIFTLICEDIRLDNGLIRAAAVEVQKQMQSNIKYILKEIIIISIENGNNRSQNDSLNIGHKYIFVYEAIK